MLLLCRGLCPVFGVLQITLPNAAVVQEHLSQYCFCECVEANVVFVQRPPSRFLFLCRGLCSRLSFAPATVRMLLYAGFFPMLLSCRGLCLNTVVVQRPLLRCFRASASMLLLCRDLYPNIVIAQRPLSQGVFVV
jgi:hypothetical protein